MEPLRQPELSLKIREAIPSNNPKDVFRITMEFCECNPGYLEFKVEEDVISWWKLLLRVLLLKLEDRKKIQIVKEVINNYGKELNIEDAFCDYCQFVMDYQYDDYISPLESIRVSYFDFGGIEYTVEIQ